MDPKKPWQSKTIIMNALMAIAAFVPPVQQAIQSHPEAIMLGWSLVNMLLRKVTSGKIQISD